MRDGDADGADARVAGKVTALDSDRVEATGESEDL
jgi:hypothetical protein